MTDLPLILAPDLRLRAMTDADAPAFHALVTAPEVARMLFIFPTDWPLAEARAFVHDWRWQGTSRFRIAIEAGGVWAGWIGATGGEEPEIFYALRPEFAGRGIAKAAVRGISDFLFARFDPPAIRAGVFTDNPASARVLESCGFSRVAEEIHESRGRLAPAPAWVYRLTNPKERRA
ncbi:MAG: GNAT family N-acetyltransferase [Paracoccaceae bacterium]